MRLKSLDMAAAVTAATGLDAILSDDHDGKLTAFVFPDTPEVTSAVALYSTGELSLPAKQLLRVRGGLYLQLKRRGTL